MAPVPAARQSTPNPDAGSCGAAENLRLESLRRHDILDTPYEERFDRVTRLARKIFRAEMATIALIDGSRQWFKSHVGVPGRETPRRGSFCEVTVERAAPLVVGDARVHPGFARSPFVMGEPFIRFYAGAPLICADGYALGTLCVMDREPRAFSDHELEILVELAQVVIDEMELRQLANVDALTGALSRRAFRAEAERAIALSARQGRPLSLLAFDLDRFKAINDGHGHGFGDVVLQRTVAACMRRLRRSDPVGRFGGEEFAVLLPNLGEAEALKVANALRRAIAAEAFETERGALRVTASFGVATLAAAAALDPMLKAADAALYLAKTMGRDRCVAAGAA